MYRQAELETSVVKLESLKENMAYEIQFNGSQQIGAKLEEISDVFKSKNIEIGQLYGMFSYIDEEINRITNLMNQDPENTDNGVSYIKRR